MLLKLKLSLTGNLSSELVPFVQFAVASSGTTAGAVVSSLMVSESTTRTVYETPLVK